MLQSPCCSASVLLVDVLVPVFVVVDVLEKLRALVPTPCAGSLHQQGLTHKIPDIQKSWRQGVLSVVVVLVCVEVSV